MTNGYTLITYGGGELLTHVFNGIVTALGDNGYTTLIRLAGLAGLAWVLLESTFRQQFLLNARWYISFILLYNTLFIPKVTLHLIDRLDNNHLTTVAHVPWGLAFFASISSEIGDSLTRLVEQNLALPDDLKYSQSGTLMASELVKAASAFEITDPNFARTLQSFMTQCVFYDLWLHKYTLTDLLTSADLWTLMSEQASPARAFRYQGTLLTCQQGIAHLKQDWQRELPSASFLYAKRLFPQYPHDARNQLLKYLPLSYHYLTGIAQEASTLMQQTMLANALAQSVLAHAQAQQGHLATYALSRAQALKRSTYHMTGELAAHWLPLLKNVFEALLYGAFLFLFLLMLLPTGVSILRSYGFALCWLQMWAPLYAILNLVMTLHARAQSLAATTLAQGQGITLSTLPGLVQINSDMAALAGYLAMSIPFIAYGIVKGGASSLAHIATAVSASTQSVAGVAASETTTGNISLGNTQWDNQSAHNTTAHHVDTNARFETGLFSYQTASGAMIHRTPSGKSVIDDRSTTLSSTATHLRLAQSVKTVASEGYTQAMTASQSHVQAAGQAMSSALRHLYELADSQGQSQAHDATTRISETASQTASLQQAKDLVHRFATEHRLTDSQAVQVLGTVSGSLGLGIRTGVGSGQLQGSASLQGMTSAQSQAVLQAGQDFVERTQFQTVVEQAIRAAQEQQSRSTNDTAQRVITSASSAYDKAHTYRQEALQSLQKAASYQRMATFATENAVTLDSNYNQWVVDSLQQQYGITQTEKLLNNPALAPHAIEALAAQAIETLKQRFVEANPTAEAVPYSASVLAEAQQAIMAERKKQQASVAEKAQQAFQQTSQPVNTRLTWDIHNQLHQTHAAITAGQAKLTEDGQTLQATVRQETLPNRHDLLQRVGQHVQETVKSTLADD